MSEWDPLVNWNALIQYVILSLILTVVQPLPSMTEQGGQSEHVLMSCDTVPHTVLLPQLCEIEFENGTRINASWYHTSVCSECLCLSSHGPCSNHRCCCTAANSTSLSYKCPDYGKKEKVLIPTECSCLSCDNVRVSFVLRVLNSTGSPLPLANVTMETVQSFVTDKYGYVGLTVMGATAKVLVHVSAAGYEAFSQSYFVVPGQTNRVEITMTEVLYVTMYPPSQPFLLHTHTLTVTPLPTHTHLTTLPPTAIATFLPRSSERVNLYLYFPAGSFNEDEEITILSKSREFGKSLENVKLPSLVEENGKQLPLMASVMGRIEIVDAFGEALMTQSVDGDFNGVLVTFTSELSETHCSLYRSDLTHGNFQLASDLIMYIRGNHSTACAVPLLVSSLVFPVTLLVATPLNTSHYLAVKAHDPFNVLQDSLLETEVLVTSHNEYGAFVNKALINSCVLVPHPGPLMIRLLGGMGLEKRLVAGSHVLYSNLSVCERRGLVDDPVTLHLMEYCRRLGHSTPSHQAHTPLNTRLSLSQQVVPLYCNVRVAVVACEATTIQLVVTYDSEMIVERFEPEYVETSESDLGSGVGSASGFGSGSGNSDKVCSYIHTLCVPFPCGRTVTIEVRQLSLTTYTDVCPGSAVFNSQDTSSVLQDEGEGSGRFVFESHGVEASVYSSLGSSEVAAMECESGEEIGLQFICSLS